MGERGMGWEPVGGAEVMESQTAFGQEVFRAGRSRVSNFLTENPLFNKA